MPKENFSNDSALIRWIQRVVDVKAIELRAMLLSFAYIFFILSSYYIIRPIRDDMGVAGGVENLPWLFTGTLAGMMIANPIFSALVSRFPRRRFIPIAYRFFSLNLLIFFALLLVLAKEQQIWVGRIFYIWTSVFNLFVVSVFWGFMADVFNTEQGKRLFGFISAGGTLGGILGAAITASLVTKIGALSLLIISAGLLELSVQCVKRFPSEQDDPERSFNPDAVREAEKPIPGGVISGIWHVMRSPYLMGISLYMLLYAMTSTILYFQQVDIVAKAFTDRAARTAFFAQIDLIVQILTIFAQTALAGRLIKTVGVGITLAILPAVSVVGFMLTGMIPTLTLLVGFQVLRRVGNFSLARPAREVLFTVTSREDKYKSKNFIDTFIYRGGDQIGSFSPKLIEKLGIGMAGVVVIAAPLSFLWLLVSLWLGYKQSLLAKET